MLSLREKGAGEAMVKGREMGVLVIKVTLDNRGRICTKPNQPNQNKQKLSQTIRLQLQF